MSTKPSAYPLHLSLEINTYLVSVINCKSIKMNSKNILTTIGVLNILQGIAFFIGAKTLTSQSFPNELLEGGGLIVGAAMHWPLSVSFIVIGIIILSTRSLEIKDAKKVLLSVGIAYLFFLINGLLQHLTTPVNVPMPALGLIASISILSFYTAFRKTT